MNAPIEAIRYFFRGAWEDYVFPFFSVEHFLLLGLLIVVSILIGVNRTKLGADPRHLVRKLLLGSLLLEQVSQYSWYFLAGTFTLGDGLPLYISRTTIIALILSYLTINYYFRTISIYWGTFAGILAVLFPVIYPFYFPHVTNFTYFFGHIVMVWSVVYFLAVEKYRFSKKGLFFALVFTNIFNYFVYRLNPLVNGNYSYFAYPPVFKDALGKLPSGQYSILVFVIYNLLILLIHLIGLKFQSKSKAELI